jgi:N6-adenosine-specific RNA methylase IME4
VIAARDVQKLAAKDTMLGLWTTDLARGIRIMESWGFAFKSYFVWVKDIVQVELTDAMRDAGLVNRAFHAIGPAGTGFWNRDRCEILLIGTRGKFVAPAMGTQPESVVRCAAKGRRAAARQAFRQSRNSPQWIEQNWPNTAQDRTERAQGAPWLGCVGQ